MIIYQFYGYSNEQLNEFIAKIGDVTLVLDGSCKVTVEQDSSIPIVHITKLSNTTVKIDGKRLRKTKKRNIK